MSEPIDTTFTQPHKMMCKRWERENEQARETRRKREARIGRITPSSREQYIRLLDKLDRAYTDKQFFELTTLKSSPDESERLRKGLRKRQDYIAWIEDAIRHVEEHWSL